MQHSQGSVTFGPAQFSVTLNKEGLTLKSKQTTAFNRSTYSLTSIIAVITVSQCHGLSTIARNERKMSMSPPRYLLHTNRQKAIPNQPNEGKL
jgi:hypothetical protein